MTRRALIIGAPDQSIPGVLKDVQNYKAFLLSPAGGAWVDREIVVLSNPSEATVLREIAALKLAKYSLTAFAGHGEHPTRRGTTKVQLNAESTMDVGELKKGALKHTLIVDCCRLLQRTPLMDSVLAKSLKRADMDAGRCRDLYDARIAACGNGLATLYACSIDETAGESAEAGGFYSSSLIELSQEWAGRLPATATTKVLSVVDAHDLAKVAVRRKSGDRQNPTAEYPRTTVHFPFAVAA